MQLQYIATLIVIGALAGCGDANSPEQQVREAIEKMEVAAEARDVGELMEHLSDDFRDVNGMGPEEAARYARAYFIANQSIHLVTRVERIEFPTDGEARARVTVGMMGREAAAAAAAIDMTSLAADLYEFKIALRREDDEWRVTFAEWLRK
jgi:5'-3' exonuclease